MQALSTCKPFPLVNFLNVLCVHRFLLHFRRPPDCSPLLKEEVGEVGVRGAGFELGVDGELQAAGLLHGVLPLVEATAVGKEGEAAVAQALDLFGIESAAAAGGQPQQLGVARGEYECGLLALDNADVSLGTLGQQVLAEEALLQFPIGRQLPSGHHSAVHPALMATAVAVGTVLHDVAGAHALLLVDLPEDDFRVRGGSDKVVFVHVLQGSGLEVEAGCGVAGEPLPEVALRGVAARNEVAGQGLQRTRKAAGRTVGLNACLLATLSKALPTTGLILLPTALIIAVGLRLPRVVAVEFCGAIVVAAGLLVVAAPHAIIKVAIIILGIYIADKALPATALRTGALLLPTPREALALELIAIFCLYHDYMLILLI